MSSTKVDANALLAASANLAELERQSQRFITIIQRPLFQRMQSNGDHKYYVLFTPLDSYEATPGHGGFLLCYDPVQSTIEVQLGDQTVHWFSKDQSGSKFAPLPMRMIGAVREHLDDLLGYMQLGGYPLDSSLMDLHRYGSKRPGGMPVS